MRDPAANYSRGVAFVEFHSIEYAAYAVQCTNGMSFGPADMAVGGDNILHVSFAKIDIMQKLLKKVRNTTIYTCYIRCIGVIGIVFY